MMEKTTHAMMSSWRKKNSASLSIVAFRWRCVRLMNKILPVFWALVNTNLFLDFGYQNRDTIESERVNKNSADPRVKSRIGAIMCGRYWLVFKTTTYRTDGLCDTSPTYQRQMLSRVDRRSLAKMSFHSLMTCAPLALVVRVSLMS